MSTYIHRFIFENKLRPGDGVVVRKRFLGILKHYVIYLGKDRGRHRFIANTDQGVQVFSEGQIGDFLQYMKPRMIIPFDGDTRERQRAINRALTYPNPDSYSLLANNCEHYFTYVHKGESYSRQAAVYGAGLAATGIVMTARNAVKSEEEDEYSGLKTIAGILLTGLGLVAMTSARGERS